MHCRVLVGIVLALLLSLVVFGIGYAQGARSHNVVMNIPMWPSEQLRVYCDTKLTTKLKPADYRIGVVPGKAWMVTCQHRSFGL